MDGIEFNQAYNQAVNHAERITAPDSKEAVMLILQLLNGLYEMIEEMQLQEDADGSAHCHIPTPTFDDTRMYVSGVGCQWLWQDNTSCNCSWDESLHPVR